MKKILSCENLTEASIVKARLENYGIACYLTNQHFTTLLPIYNNMLGSGIQVMVSENDYQEARKLLIDKIAPHTQEVVCPQCGSKNLQLGLGNQKGLKIWTVLLSLLAFIPMGNLKPKYYCNDCNAEIE